MTRKNDVTLNLKDFIDITQVKVKSFKVRGNCEIRLKLGTMCIQIFFRRIATHQYIAFS